MKTPRLRLRSPGLNHCLHVTETQNEKERWNRSVRDAGFKARKKKTDVQITRHGFASYPYLSQALALRMSLMSFFTLSHQESEPNIAMLVSQKKKLRLRETKSPPSVL